MLSIKAQVLTLLLLCSIVNICNSEKKAIASDVPAVEKKSTNRSSPMEFAELKDKLSKADHNAIILVDTIKDKENATAVIKPFLTNRNVKVRRVAVDCLTMIHTPESMTLLANVLSDPDEDNRTAALQTLISEHDRSILPQLISNLSNPDPNVASSVALIIGYIDEKSSIDPLKKQMNVEKKEMVVRDIQLALARLGDHAAQDKIAERIKISDSRVRMQTIEDIRYINDKRIAPYLFFALDDFGKGYNIGNEDHPKYARVLDAAITLASKLLNNPFSFKIKEYDTYTKDEINEAKKYLQPMTK